VVFSFLESWCTVVLPMAENYVPGHYADDV